MNCCSKKLNINKGNCMREDNKFFNLPRKFTRKECLIKAIKGFTMRASCAPYKYCKNKNIKGKKSKKSKKSKKNFF